MPRGTVDANRPEVNVQSEALVASRTEEIVEAAVRVFAERGYHGATIRDLAAELQVSVGTIFNYFRSKDEVLLAVLERPQQALLATAERFTGRPATAETVVELVRDLGRVVDAYRGYVKLVYQDLKAVTGEARQEIVDREQRLTALLERAIAGAAQEQGATLTVPAEVAAHDAVVLVHAWAFRHWAYGSLGSVDDYLEVKVPAFLRGVGLDVPAG